MKITKIQTTVSSKYKTAAKFFIAAVSSLLPLQAGKDCFVKSMQKEIPIVIDKLDKKFSQVLLKDLQTIENINTRGGITHCYSDSSLVVLKNRLVESKIKTEYIHPIDTAIKPYIPSTGQFGSIRPFGRLHLGIDIYPRLYGRKPKNPVPVVSVSDGIVISVKKSPDNDYKNIIANNIKIMSPDGKIYSYDHLGRKNDYKSEKYYPLRDLGSIVNCGDTLGYVGKTGETEIWHLHFSVEDLNIKKEQENNPVWKKLYSKYTDFATPKGQVDPLDNEKAGKISDYLKQYRVDKGPKVDYLDKL